ncbi:NAD(P)/FAD-dependent oxidoreductase [Microbacterium sp. NPDC076911]|uniref:phytoene desaturase family protein n=1 Tax=Microbacterium sp. NPDC076911 TaxID=3154958 RepID=UPI003424CB27
MHDAVIIGSGPNGLAAAITLARQGLNVHVIERSSTVGGNCRSEDTFDSGAIHDPAASVHPMGLASPFFRDFGLVERIPFVVPEVSYAHPLEGGDAALAFRSMAATCAGLGKSEGGRWEATWDPLVQHADRFAQIALNALPPPLRSDLPSLALAASVAGSGMIRLLSANTRSSALLSGVLAHAAAPFRSPATLAVGMALVTFGHARGWGVPIGGSQKIVDVLVEDAMDLGVTFECDRDVSLPGELPDARATLFATSPSTLVDVMTLSSSRYGRAINRFRYGPGACSIDLLLDGPIPWRAPGVADAPTVHIGGRAADIRAAGASARTGRHASAPYVLVNQASNLDPTRRSRVGLFPISAYCHVPNNSQQDRSRAMLQQIERYAPGVRDRIVDIRVTVARARGVRNPVNVGGDINAGALSVRQMIGRPVLRSQPYRTPIPGVYLCSSSAAPGTGVHGMAGYRAARVALRDVFGFRSAEIGGHV